jgi:GWxTD domain-containing protein
VPVGDSPEPRRATGRTPPDELSGIYRGAGLITDGGGPVPFVGSVSFFASHARDSTILLLALSLPTRALSFRRQADVYRAAYEVRLDVRRAATIVRHIATVQSVHVSTYHEVARADDAVIFQQAIVVQPGFYVLSLALRDASSPHWDSRDVPVDVPTLGEGSISTPVAVYAAQPRQTLDSTPAIIVNPRATAVFGRDTSIDLYVEAYGGAAGATVAVGVGPASNAGEPERGVDTIRLTRHGEVASDVATIPVTRIGIGQASVAMARLSDLASASGEPDRPRRESADSGEAGTRLDLARLLGSASRRVPVFVSFGDELPLADFDQMLSYLRYFPLKRRVDAVRRASPGQRAAAWGQFLRAADSLPGTTPHEALRTYFTRLRQANERYRDEGGPGWLTDRGKVFITLGEPDQVFVGGSLDANGQDRTEEWLYRLYNARLEFVDETGAGRWRLTARGQAELNAAEAWLIKGEGIRD